MSLIFKSYCTLLLLFQMAYLGFAQDNLASFSPFKEEERLNSTECHTAHLDSRGWMWFGTQDGLFRFDGNAFRFYQYDEKDTTSLRGNIIMEIVEDEKGGLWLASMGGGLNYYDPLKDSFSSYTNHSTDPQNNPPLSVSSLYLDREQQQLWLGTYNTGLYLFDIPSKRFKQFSLNPSIKENTDLFKTNSVMKVLEDVGNKQILWIAGNNGLYGFDKKEQQWLGFYPIPTGKNKPFENPRVAVLKLFMDQAGSLWLGTWEKGLVHFDTEQRRYKKVYLPEQEKLQSLWKSNIINGVVRKNKEELWISDKTKGIGVFNTQTENFSFLNTSLKGISSDPVYQQTSGLYLDPQQRLWAFYRHAGIQLSNPKNQLFHPLEIPYKTCEERFDNPINCLAKDTKRGLIYAASKICSEFYLYDTKQEKFLATPPLPFQSQIFDFRKILVDHQGIVWVLGTDMEQNEPFILQYHPDEKRWLTYDQNVLSKKFPKPFRANDLVEDQEKNIWLASSYQGLIKINTADQTVQQFSPNLGPNTAIPQIAKVIKDSKGKLWLGTFGSAVFKFDPQTQDFYHYKSYPSKDYGLHQTYITSLAEAPNGKIWAASPSDGIQIIDPNLPDTQSMASIRFEDGLPDEKVVNVVADTAGNMWLTTWKGLCKYNFADQTFVLFTETQGLNTHFLENNCLELSSSGEVLLGQNNSFIAFHPNQLCLNSFEIPLAFSHLTILNDKKAPPKSIQPNKSIQLLHHQNFFSITFSARNFFESTAPPYAYYLEGHDQNWIVTREGQNTITYSNINPGTYTFQLKAANSCGLWNTQPLRFKINISPPWWQSYWAYLFYAMALALAFLSFFQYQKRRLHFQNQLKLERQEAERLKELDQWKNRLYTNITHEFRTPLTVILGMANELPQYPDAKQTPQVKHAAQMINRSGQQLLLLINQILDLSKLESQSIPLQKVQSDIVVFLKYLTESFQSLAASQNIQLDFSSEEAAVLMDYDPEKIQQIVFNLLSNALKFTPAEGRIQMQVQLHPTHSNQLFFRVSDTGQGIAPQQLPFIFDRFYQGDSSATRRVTGTGIGLAITKELVQLHDGNIKVSSVLEQGSIFEVILPITRLAPHEASVHINSEEVSLYQAAAYLNKEVFAPSSAQEELPRLLIVEDNTDVIRYLQKCLEGQYQISIAMDGQSGIEQAIEEIPDIIISDVMMPEKDGFELCEILKKDERSSHIPIILLTARASIDDRITGLEHGADAYLTKPFNRQELLVRLEQLTSLRQALQKRYGQLSPQAPLVEDRALATEDAFVQKIRAVVEDNLGNGDFGVEDIIKSVFLSRTQVHRKLKALTGKSTVQFIRGIRLHYAKQDLLQSSKTITEIAYDYGFSNLHYFSRVFSEEFGLAPSTFRKKAN